MTSHAASPFDSWLGAGPRPLGGGAPAPRPEPGAFSERVPVSTVVERGRMTLRGGALNSVITNDDEAEGFEYLFRRLPEQGIHEPSVSFQRPFLLELGSFQVPDQQMLLLIDIRPDIYRFSGIDPNDAVPYEARRFGSQMGYEMRVASKHVGKTRFELEPVAAQTGLDYTQSLNTDVIYNPGTLPPNAAFVQNLANQFGNASGAGMALMPQRHFRFGPTSLPMTIAVREKETVSFRVVIFKPVLSPIAFFEMDMAGVLLPLNTAEQIIKSMSFRGGGL